jgi:hypothetical protein
VIAARAHILASILWACSFALASGSVALAVVGSETDVVFFFFPSIAFASVGLVVARRRPGNPIGWLFCAAGLLFAGSSFSTAYGYQALVADPGSLPGGAVAAWLFLELLQPVFFLGALLLFVFPTGTLPSVRWRYAAWLLVAGTLAALLGGLTPGFLEDPFEHVRNPVAVESAGTLFEVVAQLGWPMLIVSLVAGGLAMARRFRQAGSDERQQLKWFVSAGALLAILFLIQTGSWSTGSTVFQDTVGAATLVALGGLPIAVGFAILRYRLYEIDLIVRRTLVYGVLSAGLAGLYFAIVLALQAAFSGFAGGSDLAVAGSTLAVAALFRPVRLSIQTLVDRRFYRRRYDAQRTLAAFSARLRDEIDLDTLAAELRGVVEETIQPAHVSLWLRSPR